MTPEVAPDSGRTRPQSGGFRTFLSWLKRDDKLNERSSSVESVNSNGSDRTVTSFAFFTPNHYQSPNIEPVTVPPPGPPTNSYRKRIQDRNLRLHLDRNRDITLCGKYHLTEDYADQAHYEAFSLPAARYDRQDRARRATSVCLQRRAPYVPGKRHAPAPPIRASSLGPMNTQSIKRVKKRPAPPPPNVNVAQNKENIELSVNRSANLSTLNKTEINNNISSKESKAKDKMDDNIRRNPSERSFLKQIFEGKKKISMFDPVAVRLLPSISELDRQAAEIIQMKLRNEKTKGVNINETNKVTPPNQNVTPNPVEKTGKKSLINNMPSNDKEDLKKILKEMKDSLPKHTKPTNDTNVDNVKPSTSNIKNEKLETIVDVSVNVNKWHWSPLIKDIKEKNPENSPMNSEKNKEEKKENEIQKTKPPSVKQDNSVNYNNVGSNYIKPNNKFLNTITKENTNQNAQPIINSTVNKVDVNIKTSTGLSDNAKKLENDIKKEDCKTAHNRNREEIINLLSNSETQAPLPTTVVTDKNNAKAIKDNNQNKTTINTEVVLPKSSQLVIDSPKTNILENSSKKPNFKLEEKHVDLITELERCILNGDENGAAKAAAHLAQLRVNRLRLSSLLNDGDKNINQPINKVSNINTPDICDVRKQIPENGKASTSRSDETIKIEINSQQRGRSNSIPDIIPSTSKIIVHNESSRKDLVKTDNGNSSDNKLPNNIKNTTTKEENKKHIVAASSSKVILENNKATGNASKSKTKIEDNLVRVEVWVEDREKARGPVGLHVSRDWDFARLRRQAEITLGLPMRLQRWIVGNTLCSDDNAQIQALAGPDFKALFYLCLVDSELNKKASLEDSKEANILEEEIPQKVEDKPQNVYKELMELEQLALVTNLEPFDCGVCLETCAVGDGAVLRDCLHSFCRQCLADAVRHCQEPQVSCPGGDCLSRLQEREIRALVSERDFERWLERGLAAAESGTRGTFHCRTPDCTAWAMVEPGVITFPCKRCGLSSCIPCQAIHEGMTCEQYRAKQAQETARLVLEGKVDDEGTRALLDTLIAKGEALPCPECNTIITKKWGCDWVKCSACKTEICWITRGRRWGPAGKGDTSAGCRCGVDGKRCHPSCAYCH